jgi:hypothetical protein
MGEGNEWRTTLTALEDMTWTFDNIAGIVEVVSLTLNMATRWMVILTIDLFAREEWGCFGEYRVASKGVSATLTLTSRNLGLWIYGESICFWLGVDVVANVRYCLSCFAGGVLGRSTLVIRNPNAEFAWDLQLMRLGG